MKFIDLFAGLGGFHVGLKENGHECVFSCEIDDSLRHLYEINHNIKPHDDIRTIKEIDIPEHDILCAGFPCQPFSLAGKKKGAKCPESGKLIDHVIRIAKFHQPKFIMLENVPNILTIEDGKFWAYLNDSFQSIGYNLTHKVLSPVEFGIPQNRKRIFIVGIRTDLSMSSFNWPDIGKTKINECQLANVLNHRIGAKPLELSKSQLLLLWQELLNNLLINDLSNTSIVAPEFGATYPKDFNGKTLDEMKVYKGAYGTALNKCETWDELLFLLPSYVRKNKKIPDWILKSVNFSRDLYNKNKLYCDEWSKKLNKQNNSWQILEWRGGLNNLDIFAHIIQFRASGIRVLKPNIAPSLIAMTPTQTPIIPAEGRYISPSEAAQLQFLHKLKKLPEKHVSAFKALGNAVNAKIVELISYNFNSFSIV